jgi:large subunit ribosomal protein L1
MAKTIKKTKTTKIEKVKKDLTKEFNLNELKTLESAVELLPKLSTSKFVGGVDLDIVLNLKEKQKKESVRGSVDLPHKFGEAKKVVVLCDEKDIKTALAAGAFMAGLDDVKEALLNGTVQPDIVISTPDVMTKIVQLAKVLGPKGLMPNPKNGTISADVDKTVKSFVGGKMNFKMTPDQGVIRSKVGKLDMNSTQLTENIVAFLKSVFAESKKLNANPFKKIIVKPTMGGSVKLDISDIISKVA